MHAVVRIPVCPARQSGLRGFISPLGRIADIPAGYAGGSQSLVGNFRYFGFRAGRVLGAGLWSPFFNFPFGGAETGSIADTHRIAFEATYRKTHYEDPTITGRLPNEGFGFQTQFAWTFSTP